MKENRLGSKGSIGPAGDEVQNLIPIAFDCKGTEVQTVTDGSHQTLRSMGHNHSHQNAGGHAAVAFAIQERAVSENPDNGPQGAGFRADGSAYTLEARHHVQAVSFDLNQITSKTNRSQPDPAVHHTLSASSTPPHLATPWAVRRLTPWECERLQGFPDDYTDVPYRRRNWTHDAPRYKALGNSMAVNVMDVDRGKDRRRQRNMMAKKPTYQHPLR